MSSQEDAPGQTKKTGSVEEEIMSEVTERSMEANMKILVGNEISHAKRVDVYAEAAVKNAVEFSQKANDAYLERIQLIADAYMNHTNDMNKQVVENNRYTLDRLYSVFTEEAVALSTLLSGFQEYLKKQGWTAPATPPA